MNVQVSHGNEISLVDKKDLHDPPKCRREFSTDRKRIFNLSIPCGGFVKKKVQRVFDACTGLLSQSFISRLSNRKSARTRTIMVDEETPLTGGSPTLGQKVIVLNIERIRFFGLLGGGKYFRQTTCRVGLIFECRLWITNLVHLYSFLFSSCPLVYWFICFDICGELSR